MGGYMKTYCHEWLFIVTSQIIRICRSTTPPMHAVPHISVIVFFIVAVSAVAITLIRIHLKNKLKKFSENLTHIPSYRDKSNAEPGCEGLEVLSIGNFIDIPTDLTNAFNGKIISSTQKGILSIIITHISRKQMLCWINWKFIKSIHTKYYQVSSMISNLLIVSSNVTMNASLNFCSLRIRSFSIIVWHIR